MNSVLDKSVIEDKELGIYWHKVWIPRGHGNRHSPEERAYREARAARRETFLRRNGLRESKAGESISKVVGRQLFPGVRAYGGRYYSFHEEQIEYPKALGWFDHMDIFCSDRGYVLTTQPYGLTIAKISALDALCFELGIQVSVFVSDGWHYPGVCPLVVVHKDELVAAAQEPAR